jgi:predicted SAM-dependent methyltransferase
MLDRASLRQSLKRVKALVVLNKTLHRGVRQARSLKRRASDPRVIRHYLDTHSVRKLQIGSGPNLLTGWLNTDLVPDVHLAGSRQIVFLDAVKPFPFDNMTFDYVFSEHMIEHVSAPDARFMCRECFRILRPGGRIRIATPNLAAIVGLYHEPGSELEQHYTDWVMTKFWPDHPSGNPRCYVINQMFNSFGHQLIYDQETPSATLTDAGFDAVTFWDPGESDDPVLRGIESHGAFLADEDVNRLETMVLEATRPAARL